MDISVHCDLDVFDWLIRWIKSSENSPESHPIIDTSNVVPILVSSVFLQMEPLVCACLEFLKENMNEIIHKSSNISSINDSIWARLAGMVSNSDLETFLDPKDKIQSRMYCMFIVELSKTSPSSLHHHYSTLHGLRSCAKCEKLVRFEKYHKIPCKLSNMWVNQFGEIMNVHIWDLNWNVNDYIRTLFEDSQSWRSVYWRLWGDCHFLLCGVCHHYFAVNQMSWCIHHPESPQYFTMDNHRTLLNPVGRYQCCGAKAPRFQPLHKNLGCQYKDHVPTCCDEGNNYEILKLFRTYKRQISVAPNESLLSTSKLVGCKENSPSWNTLVRIPPRLREGFIPRIEDLDPQTEEQNAPTYSLASQRFLGHYSRQATRAPSGRVFKKQDSKTSRAPSVQYVSGSDDDTSSSESINSEESAPCSGRVKVKTYTTKRADFDSLRWNSKLSIRSNQDNQRTEEETKLRRLNQYLIYVSRRLPYSETPTLNPMSRSSSHYHGINWTQHVVPKGGLFVRLEQEWRESHSFPHASAIGRRGGGKRSRSDVCKS